MQVNIVHTQGPGGTVSEIETLPRLTSAVGYAYPEGYLEVGTGTDGSLPFKVDQAGNVTAVGLVTTGVNTQSGGSNTAASAPILTGVAGSNGGGGVQLSDKTRDYMVYLQIGTAGTAWVVTMGHLVAANDVTIHASGVATAGQTLTFRLPASWYFLWTASTATLAQSVAVGC